MLIFDPPLDTRIFPLYYIMLIGCIQVSPTNWLKNFKFKLYSPRSCCSSFFLIIIFYTRIHTLSLTHPCFLPAELQLFGHASNFVLHCNMLFIAYSFTDSETQFFYCQTIVNMYPLLLRGSEEDFLMLLSKGGKPLNEKLLRMLAAVGSHISLKLR